jgi:hypothetical protein
VSLILIITNTGTGPDVAANYRWKAMVNQELLAEGEVLSHDRALSWEELVDRVVKQVQDTRLPKPHRKLCLEINVDTEERCRRPLGHKGEHSATS